MTASTSRYSEVETPRTDARKDEIEQSYRCGDGSHNLLDAAWNAAWRHARQLERELNNAPQLQIERSDNEHGRRCVEGHVSVTTGSGRASQEEHANPSGFRVPPPPSPADSIPHDKNERVNAGHLADAFNKHGISLDTLNAIMPAHAAVSLVCRALWQYSTQSAIQEPTQAMLDAAWLALAELFRGEGGWIGKEAAYEQARLTWRAMIGAR